MAPRQTMVTVIVVHLISLCILTFYCRLARGGVGKFDPGTRRGVPAEARSFH